MSYTKQTWTDGDSNSKFNATRMNHIEDGINDNSSDIATNTTNIATNTTNIGTLSNLNTTDKTSCVNAINEVNNKFNYSTDEQVVGTYLGKTKYAKLINIGTVDFYPSTNKNIIHNISNFERLISCNYSMYFSEDSSYYINWDKIIGIKSNSTNIIFTTTSFSNYVRFINMVLKIEYTKTTD